MQSSNLWMTIAGPLYSEYLATFFLAFCLGPICAAAFNLFSDTRKIGRQIIEDFGGQLEKFLYDSIIDRQLVWIALKNGKVYIGWVINVPHPKPRKDGPREHFSVLPIRSGYMNEKLEPKITTDYEGVYVQIMKRELLNLDIEDFEIIIPLTEVSVVRAYSTDLKPQLFKNDT